MQQDLNENIILFDWVSFVVFGVDDPDYVIELLGLINFNWTIVNGAKGYKYRKYCNSISIHYDGPANQGIWCEISGQGCRFLETYGIDFFDLFEIINNSDGFMHLTRLDIALDDHVGLLDIDKICKDTLNLNWVSRFRNYHVNYTSGGNSVQLGSRQSNALVRIYDKAAERELDNTVIHWVRVELQLRDERANEFIKMLKLMPAGELFVSVLNNYLRFVKPNKTESNKSRWKTCNYWLNFLNYSTDKISIFTKPKMDYNLKNLEKYVFDMAGGAIDTYLMLTDLDTFCDKISARKSVTRNPKYQKLIDDYYNIKNA